MSAGRSKSVLGSDSGSSSGHAVAPKRTSSKPASPKQQAMKRASSGLGGGIAPPADQQDNADHLMPSSSSRPASGKSTVTSARSSLGGPVKGLYRPANATPASAIRPVEPISVPQPATAGKPKKPYVRRPTPEDSDYDSDEVVSEEESEEERPLVHPAAEPLPFRVEAPQWDRLEGDEAPETAVEEYPSDAKLQLNQAHLVPAGAQLHPHTSVQLEHQSNPITAAAAALEQPVRADGTKANHMSFSSTPAPEASNDLLYTDAHAPYTYSRHSRPLTIWLIGKPLSGKKTLARRLQRELGHVAQQGNQKKEWIKAAIPHLTPEFLIAYAKETSSYPGAPKFAEIDTIVAGLNEGKTVDQATLLKLFIYALHSEKVAYHGYILADLPFPASELSAIASTYPVLVERGVWPPQYIFDLELSNEEVLARLATKSKAQVEKRLSEAMGFRLPRERTLEEDADGPEAEEGPSSNAQSRPVSAASSRHDGGEGRDEEPYPGWTALHRPADTLEELGEEGEEVFWSPSRKEFAMGTGKQLNHTHLLLSSEADLQSDLVAYETTRTSLVKLIRDWSQFHSGSQPRTLSDAQTLHRFSAAQSVTTLLKLILHALGQNKWTHYALAQHLPFVAKEELKPIEEDEIREVFLLPNLANSNPKEKDGSLVNLSSIPLPATQDPSGLDLETEGLYDSVSHVFGAFQTYCPVSLLEEDRLVEGSEDYCVTYQGLIYLCANEVCMRRFQENPERYTVRNPPTLPKNYVVSIVGGQACGKTTLARLFAERYGWKVLTLDGTEASITRAAAITAAGGRFILDNGPSTIPLLEFANQAGLKMDKIVYLYVDDVELLPGRLRLAKKLANPGSEEEARAEEARRIEEAAAAAEAKEKEQGKKGKKKKPKATSATSATAGDGNDDEPTQEEEELMDRVEEFQNEWATTLLPYLEEHLFACTEVNNTTPLTTAPSATTSSAVQTIAASSAPSGTATPVPPQSIALSALAAQANQAQQAIESVFEVTRQLVDPFYLFRSLTAARRLTADEVDRSKDEDRIPRASEARSLKYGDTVFCPVCLIARGLLVPGNANEAVACGADSYSCCSKKCVEEFLANPPKYNLHSPQALEKLEPTMPALRILVTGARATGKSHVAAMLKQEFHLTHSFSLSEFLTPALRSLAQKTLDLVLAAEKKLSEKKVAREAKRAARKAERKAKRREERLAAQQAGEEPDEEDEDDDVSSEEDDVEDAQEDDPEGEDELEPEVLEERKDVLRDYLATNTESIEYADTLSLLLEAELFTHAQLEGILRDIFHSHAYLDPAAGHSHSNVAGWVCEVDLHNSLLLQRLEAVLKDTDSDLAKQCKPHVILPLESTSRVAIQRLVQREQARRANSKTGKSQSSDDEAAAAERHRKREAHKQKVEQEKQREAEALAAKLKAEEEKLKAKQAKKFGAKKMTLKERKEAAEKEKQEKEAEAAAAAAAKAAAVEKSNSSRGKNSKGKKPVESKEDDSAAEDSSVEGTEEPAAEDPAIQAAQSLSPGEPREKTAAEVAAEEELERLTNTLSELYKQSQEVAETFLTSMKAYVGGFIILDAISGSAYAKAPVVFQQKLFGVFKAFLQAQAALFITPIPVTQSDADKLLRNGMKSFRTFGSYCPCCLKSGDGVAFDCKPIPSYHTTSSSASNECFPIVWNHSVIFTCSRVHRAEFLTNPKGYSLTPPPRPVLSQSLIVLESASAPSASRALAEKLSTELNLVHLTLERILEQVSLLPTVLGRRISSALHSGAVLSNSLLIQALHWALGGFECSVQGWVLSGFPQNKDQARLMKKFGIVAQEVVSVRGSAVAASASPSSVLARLVSSLEEPLESGELPPIDPAAPKRRWGKSNLVPKGVDLEEFVQEGEEVAGEPENAEDLATQLELEVFYGKNYNNVTRLVTRSEDLTALSSTGIPTHYAPTLWHQSELLFDLFSHHQFQRQEYRLATHSTTFNQGKPGRIAGLGFTRQQLIQNASEYRDYCPISWINDGLLTTSSDVLANQFTVEYHQKFYRLSSQAHVELFMANPDAYSSSASSSSPPLPKDLPFRVSPGQIAKIEEQHCELQGYCPVTISQSQRQGSLRVEKGLPEFTACYRGRVYRFVSSSALQSFLSTPAYYAQVTLPQKMPPKAAEKQSAESLLKLGKTLAFMEQTFQALLMKGLKTFEHIPNQEKSLRIKYPALPLNSSALIYLALFLKKNNPKNQTWVTEKYQNKLNDFLSHCQLIPSVAAQYRFAAVSEKPVEESKEQSPPAAAPAAVKPVSAPVVQSKLTPTEQAQLYDTLRAEMRAHAAGTGSRKSLAQFFERYLR